MNRALFDRVLGLLEHGSVSAPDEDSRVFLRSLSGWVRTHQIITAKIIRVAAKYVYVCEFCPKKALYRIGLNGRCNTHKSVKSSGYKWYVGLKETKGRAIDEARRAGDYFALSLESRRLNRTAGKHR